MRRMMNQEQLQEYLLEMSLDNGVSLPEVLLAAANVLKQRGVSVEKLCQMMASLDIHADGEETEGPEIILDPPRVISEAELRAALTGMHENGIRNSDRSWSISAFCFIFGNGAWLQSELPIGVVEETIATDEYGKFKEACEEAGILPKDPRKLDKSKRSALEKFSATHFLQIRELILRCLTPKINRAEVTEDVAAK